MALYNFAITGSVRPDALFLAWGPGGVTSARLGQGVLGLLDFALRHPAVRAAPDPGSRGARARRCAEARTRIAGGARLLPDRRVRRQLVGRGLQPGPLRHAGRAAPRGARRDRTRATSKRRGVVALAFALVSWTGLMALALRLDPHGANDSWLLLAKSTFADGRQYMPGLFIRTWADAAPGLAAQLATWALLTAATAFWLKRAAAEDGRAGASPLRALAGVAATLLLAAFVLEHAAYQHRVLGRPGPGEVQAGEGATIFLTGNVFSPRGRGRGRPRSGRAARAGARRANGWAHARRRGRLRHPAAGRPWRCARRVRSSNCRSPDTMRSRSGPPRRLLAGLLVARAGGGAAAHFHGTGRGRGSLIQDNG